MKKKLKIHTTVRSLLKHRSLGVLCTSGPQGPHASLVAFAASRDLGDIIFATLRATQKYDNLTLDPRVCLLVDSRTNEVADFTLAEAATVVGRVSEIPDADKAKWRGIFLRKHPSLRTFTASPDCALFRIRARRFNMVSRFAGS
jgi:heme iron utilization protein